MATSSAYQFIAGIIYQELPAAVQHMAKRCLLDLVGTAIAGTQTPLSRTIRNHAIRAFGAGAGAPSARLMFDGRRASPVGAALAGGMTIDSFDAHDGHVLTKGHAGCAVLPALLAVAETRDISGAEFLASLAAGYEIAIRAGISQHATAPDYHTSGSWNALGAAAIAAHLWGLDETRFRHAIGIAEFHGPRSQMMRCIDFPTMLKDGSGWGAMGGISAAYLAEDGFTGAPAIVVEGDNVKSFWNNLGKEWRFLGMYFKPYPICRWAQPSVEAALILRHKHNILPETIDHVEIDTFDAGVRLNQRRPETTEEAQYSLPFPVAAALVRGQLLPTDIAGASLVDAEILSMNDRIKPITVPEIDKLFPAERMARARIYLKDGTLFESELTPARGDTERPLSDAEIAAKYHSVADHIIGGEGAALLRSTIETLDSARSVRGLLDLVLAPVDAQRKAVAA
ncbi:MmgE/PrpD family protein [Mesorhizobium sp. M0909]|uniref:MmgE/PrpD family protein n=1 Tax=Mesorhizobium sp. M0909 TaxID=2957024 RepID=UPI00333D0860